MQEVGEAEIRLSASAAPASVHRASCCEGSLTPRPSLARRLMRLMGNEGDRVDLLFMGRWRRGQGSSPPSGCFGVRCPPKNAGVAPWGRSSPGTLKLMGVGLLWAPQN